MIGHTPDIPETGSDAAQAPATDADGEQKDAAVPKEIGGRDGPDPTRYGDWEKNGRCIDF
jgi:hypothetical protein